MNPIFTKSTLVFAIIAILSGCTAEKVSPKSSEKPSTPMVQVELPKVEVSEVKRIPTVMIPVVAGGEKVLDVSSIDAFIDDVKPNVRHYPPNFPNPTQKYNATEHIKKYVDELKDYATDPNASYEVLIRSATLNGMARNLDQGSEYAVRGNEHVAKALKIKPNDLEANVLYGILLSEGGAFKTSLKYLNKAVEMGSVEAEQTIAQSDLMNDKKQQALSRLQKLQAQNPDNKQIADQIAIIEGGKYRLWDLPAPDVNVAFPD